MTNLEACQFVVEFSKMGNGVETFVLDMGELVKIVDQARNPTPLSRLRPDDDSRIEFTGVRPGKRLHEEIDLFDRNILPARHEKVKIFPNGSLSGESMVVHLDALRDISASRDLGGLVGPLKMVLADYSPLR